MYSLIFSTLLPCLYASFAISFSSIGTNSCNGGSRNLIVTGHPSRASYNATKSDCWYGRILSRASSLSSTVSAQIISLKVAILLSSKNICSVRHRPIPSAPSSLAFLASWGVSALVLTESLLYLSAHAITLPNSPAIWASTVGIMPSYILPVEPSIEIASPSVYSLPARVNFLLASSMLISPQPDTQHLPIPLATTAAWLVIPPLTVSIPCAAFIPVISSGEVSRRTKTTFSPRSAHATASSAENTTLPQAAPGDAPSPLPAGVAFLSAVTSNWGWRSVSRLRGSIMSTASSSVRIPSSTRSHAILRAAWAVLLPFLVWSIYSLPCSTVNSISCISL